MSLSPIIWKYREFRPWHTCKIPGSTQRSYIREIRRSPIRCAKKISSDDLHVQAMAHLCSPGLRKGSECHLKNILHHSPSFRNVAPQPKRGGEHFIATGRRTHFAPFLWLQGIFSASGRSKVATCQPRDGMGQDFHSHGACET